MSRTDVMVQQMLREIQRLKEVEELCHSVMATLVVNRGRGSLRAFDIDTLRRATPDSVELGGPLDCTHTLYGMIDEWEKSLAELCPKDGG